LWKSKVEPDRPQMTIQCGACTLHDRHTLRICNTCCLATVTVVMRTRINLTFIHTLPVLLRI